MLNVRYTSVYNITYFIEENHDTDYSIPIHSELPSPLTRLSAEMSTSENIQMIFLQMNILQRETNIFQ